MVMFSTIRLYYGAQRDSHGSEKMSKQVGTPTGTVKLFYSVFLRT